MYIVVFVTAKDHDQARKISKALVEDKLVACANIVPGIQSVFWWDGKVDEANEVLLILKTKKSLLKKITEKVKSLHSYDVPEIIALPIIDGSKDYLRWLSESVR